MNFEKEKSIPNEAQPFDLLTPKDLFFRNNVLLLNLDEEDIDLSRAEESANQHGLERKDDFHITVIGYKNSGQILKSLKSLPDEQARRTQSQIDFLVRSSDWRFSLKPELYHVSKDYVTTKAGGRQEKEHRQSIIQMIYLPGSQHFYDQLNSLLQIKLEVPPAHITLFTGGDDEEKSKSGIGINSDEELNQLKPELIS